MDEFLKEANDFEKRQVITPRPRKSGTGSVKDVLDVIRSGIALLGGVMKLVIFLMIVGVIGAAFMGDVVDAPYEDSFSVIKIEGSITGARGYNEAGYDHRRAVEYIKDLIDNRYDKGILLFMDTPGGTLYHSDELYYALMEYKQKTERPVYAYMASMCASGGYYICMATDYITASRVAMTGSLGVIMSVTDASGLFDKLGLRTVLIDSGEHKGAGALGTEFTARQESVLQSIIDEDHDLFVSLIRDGRNLDEKLVRQVADGRIYSANQALEYGLIDEIGQWDKALADFKALTGVDAYYPDLASGSLFGGLLAQTPLAFLRNESAEISYIKQNTLPNGVPLVIAPEFIK